MKNKLQTLFPMIKTRPEVMTIIYEKPELLAMFQSWTELQQEEFLSFVTGAKGVKLLYDSFFKEILNPETVPERLNQLLSLLLGKNVHVAKVLPPDNSRIANESSLVIMDIVVTLDDGSYVDVEIQKVGYLFPGQRSACYSSDLLLRQYKLARSKCTEDNSTNKRFSYKNVHNVYSIVFFDSSPKSFKAFPDCYLHKFQQKSDTGLELELLQRYFFIPLDIFKKILQNKGINNDLEAWLAFLSCDDPEIIAALVEYSPMFKEMYTHLYEICQNVEGVMKMFSTELLEMDRNTTQLMIDEQQDEINRLSASITEKDNTIAELKARIAELQNPENHK